jgi:hypothetical protein
VGFEGRSGSSGRLENKVLRGMRLIEDEDGNVWPETLTDDMTISADDLVRLMGRQAAHLRPGDSLHFNWHGESALYDVTDRLSAGRLLLRRVGAIERAKREIRARYLRMKFRIPKGA